MLPLINYQQLCNYTPLLAVFQSKYWIINKMQLYVAFFIPSENDRLCTGYISNVRKIGYPVIGHVLQLVIPSRTDFGHMSRTFIYARVSTVDQNTDNQVYEIESAGFAVNKRRIVCESISGSVAAVERPQFARLLDRLEPSDVLIVTKLDRLGRNAMDVRATVEKLAADSVRVHCLALGGISKALRAK